MRKILLATSKIFFVIGLAMQGSYSMEDQKGKYTNEQVQAYYQQPEISKVLEMDYRFNTIKEENPQDVLKFVRENYMEARYVEHRALLQKIFEDYSFQPSYTDIPSILVIGPGNAHEVRVLRDLNKNVELIVEPEAESLKIASLIGNIMTEKTCEGLIQDVPSEWNEKFDIAIWQYFVAPDFKDTLKSIYTLLKPNCIFYPASDAHMLSYIHFDEEIHNLYDEESLSPINFDGAHSGKMTEGYFGILRLTKK